jgi:hypothetical protein
MSQRRASGNRFLAPWQEDCRHKLKIHLLNSALHSNEDPEHLVSLAESTPIMSADEASQLVDSQ